MPEFARVCQSMPEYARVSQSMPEYARVCQSMPEYARVCQSMPEYARHTSYLSFFLHKQNFWRIKFTPKKPVNYDKIHRKLPFFCVITAKYTVNCQFFALNL